MLMLLSACGGGGNDTASQAGMSAENGAGDGESPGQDPGDDIGDDPGSTPDDPNDYTPQPTDVGTPIGDTVSALIGVSGGQLSSRGGVLTVEVPAGRADRISLKGLRTTTPMTIRWSYTDNDRR